MCLTFQFSPAVNECEFSALVGPLPGGDKCALTVSQGEERAEVKDILAGDVWVCSGTKKIGFRF